MKKIVLLLITVCCFTMADVLSQNASVTIANISSCNNTEVQVPVTVQNLTDIGAMTLNIAFDTAVLHFDTIQNIHPQFAGMVYNMMYAPQPRLSILYANMAGATLTSGKLLDIVFMYKNGMTMLDLLPSCELTTTGFVTVPALYNDGSVKHLITITQQPVDVTVHQPEPAVFQVAALPEAATYKWQQSTNNGVTFADMIPVIGISGVNSPQLTLYATSPAMNGRLYRCKITSDGCSLFSAAGKLTVLPPLVSQSILLKKGWNSLSTFILPQNHNPEMVFAGIISNLIMVAGDQGIFYPAGNINTLGDFDPTGGYSVKVQREATLVLTGNRQTQKTIALSTGYNLMPVIAECEVNISTLFGKNLAQVQLVRDPLGLICYWPAAGIYNLQTLLPGRAYLVKISKAIQVTFPECP